MTINTVVLANTFNEFRTTVNEVISAVNAVSGGSGVINATTIIGGTVSANNLTSGRLTLASAGGQLVDDSALTFDTSTNVLTLGGTTDATSTSDGTLVVAGGVGIAKKLFVGANTSIAGTLTVEGDLHVTGNTVTFSANNLALEDTFIYLNAGSTISNPDLGFAGNYNDGTYRHAGLFRDATDGKWKFFKNYTPEPDNPIDVSHATFAYADLAIHGLEANNNISVATGKGYQVNGTEILNATTLGSSVVSSSLTTVGTIGTGVWQGTIVNPTYGGTGVNNGSNTITLGGNLTTSGAYNTTVAVSANTSVTLPTTGTLVGSADTGTVTNTMLAGSIANGKLVNSTIIVGNTTFNLGDTSTTLAGLTSVTSTAFVGTLSTAAQPNVTSVGTLTSLTVSGNTTFSSTGAMKLPSGTTAENAGYATVGMLRFNTDLDALEVYKAGGWASAGGSGATSSVRLFAAGIASGGDTF